MQPIRYRTLIGPGLVFASLSLAVAVGADVKGWLSWRGPAQTGVSAETGLPDTWKPGGVNDLWSYKLSGGGTPVIANGKVYALGYEGQGPDLQEVLVCLDAETGKKRWEKRFNDYVSDITYDRYAIGSPCVDAETGNVYVLTSAGFFSCFTADGKPLWEHAMMEDLGRLTFTNGRTGGPTIEHDLVIVRGITSNWGGEGAAQDRLYAFDKKSGGLVWSCSPGAPPKDNSFARPYFGWLNGKRVFYTGTGDGSLMCANARTGEVQWRYPISAGGMNSSVVLYKNNAIVIHNDENIDSSNKGRMTAVKVDTTPKPDPGNPPTTLPGPPLLDRSAEAWRNDTLGAISSSPVIVGSRLYQVTHTGQLACVDAETGKVLYQVKLGPDQLHASPLYADGKLYIPLQNGLFFILKPNDTGVQELAKVQLEGRAIGAPSAWNGKVYVHTTEKLYCFGKKGNNSGTPATVAEEPYPKPGKTVALQVIPSEVRLHPGEKAKFSLRGIDANGFVTETFDSKKAKWAKYIPPTARVRSEMNGEFNAGGELVASSASGYSAGAFQADIDGLKGTFRGRVMPDVPLSEDFEKYTLSEKQATEGVNFAYPPLPWIGARFKFEVRDVDGSKALTKTLDNIFFQRATVFIGHPESKNYTMEADVRVDGNRRTRSSVGLINQRYLITLEGNADQIQITSNQERIRAIAPFKVAAKQWYHLKTRVDVSPNGSGIVRAKAWPKGEQEPSTWTIEFTHKNAHKSGSPGLFGFSPQSLFRVYIDNIQVTSNADRVSQR